MGELDQGSKMPRTSLVRVLGFSIAFKSLCMMARNELQKSLTQRHDLQTSFPTLPTTFPAHGMELAQDDGVDHKRSGVEWRGVEH